ncbi:MAG: HAMP domain-containing histidine kinase [Lachnospiraceae bacterium]|nr:HAMP domain-containing histidine kinase [Lachnospiraceae bacterium]
MKENICKADHETKEAWVRRYGRDAGEIRRRRGIVLAAVLLVAVVLTVCGGALAASSWNRLLCLAGAAAQEGMGQELTDWLVQRDSAALREQGAQLLADSGYAGALRAALVQQMIRPLLGVGAAILLILFLCLAWEEHQRRKLAVSLGRLAEDMEALVSRRAMQESNAEEGTFGPLTASWTEARAAMEFQREHVTGEHLQMSRFLEDISHQLKTPLTGLSLQLEALQMSEPTPERRERLAQCGCEAAWMQEMVRVLLRLAQLDANRVTFRRRWEDLGELVAQCRLQIEPLAEERGVTLEFPEPAAAPLVCDRFWIREAILNLLKNAVDHAPAGTAVRLTLRREGSTLLLDVCNQGEAIPEAKRERIFERFYQAEQGRTGSLGVGIGLSLAWEIAARCQGSLTLLPEEGDGTVFRLALPESTGKDK